jgi:signal transduction histidine kinase
VPRARRLLRDVAAILRAEPDPTTAALACARVLTELPLISSARLFVTDATGELALLASSGEPETVSRPAQPSLFPGPSSAEASFKLQAAGEPVGRLDVFPTRPLSPEATEALSSAADLLAHYLHHRQIGAYDERRTYPGELAATLGQDIGNMLAVVLGYTELLLGMPLSGPARTACQEIEAAARRAEALAELLSNAAS